MDNLELAKAFKDYSNFLDQLSINTNSKRKAYNLMQLKKDVDRLVYTLKRKSTL